METSIVIHSRTARKWLYKPEYVYRDIRKDVFVDGHKPSDFIDHTKTFLHWMKKLKPYIMKFEANWHPKA